MQDTNRTQIKWTTRVGIAAALVVVESAVFAILTLAPYLPRTTLLYAHVGLTVALLAAALVLRQRDRVGLVPDLGLPDPKDREPVGSGPLSRRR